MKVWSFSPGSLAECAHCGRPAEHMIKLVWRFFCTECITEALALLRHAESASHEVYPNVVSEE